MTMWTDFVVDEIHQIRQQMLADVGGNIDELMAKCSAHQAAHARVVINRKLPADVARDRDTSAGGHCIAFVPTTTD
jgi:hypothetical protein